MRLRTAARVALVITASALLTAPAAQARSSYCSPTGDYCTGVLERGASVQLRISSFAFRGQVRLCVRPPRGGATCKAFRLYPKRGGLHESTVRWGERFPRRGRGRYEVRYQKFGNTLGRPLSFRR